MNKHPDNETYIEPLRSQNSKKIKKSLDDIYIKFYSNISYHVTNNNGTKEDAEDVFQETLIVLYKNAAKDKSFVLRGPLKNWLFGVSKKVWLKKLEKKGRKKVTFSAEKELNNIPDKADIIKTLEEFAKKEFYSEMLLQLDKQCQKVIKLFEAGKSMKEIAKKLGYKNDKTARNAKYKCWKKLIKLVQSDSRYDELK